MVRDMTAGEEGSSKNQGGRKGEISEEGSLPFKCGEYGHKMKVTENKQYG